MDARDDDAYETSVFLNVPFDPRYLKLFHALVFTIHECGLVARCALETDDGSEIRREKLIRIIEGCRFGIHDLSRTTLDTKHRLPRFNMPLELGLFLGAKAFGVGHQREKSALILDSQPYRYQIFCSDIAGQDIKAHHNDVGHAVRAARDWLFAARKMSMPGARELQHRYATFRRQLPVLCRVIGSHVSELGFVDYRVLVEAWRERHPA